LERQNKNGSSKNIQRLLDDAKTAEWCTLVNDDDLYVETEKVKHYDENEKKSFCTFYTAAYVKTLFPNAEILAPPHNAYPSNEESVLQHCCVLRKTAC
jgi:hypothetical protein